MSKSRFKAIGKFCQDNVFARCKLKSGEDVAFAYSYNVENNQRGFVVHAVYAWIDGEAQAYNAVNYVPAKNFDLYYPTVFNYIHSICGVDLGLGNAFDGPTLNPKSMDFEEYKVFIQRVLERRQLIHSWLSGFDSIDNKSHIQLVEIASVFDRIINDPKAIPHFCEGYGEMYREFRNYHRDKPFSEFINTRGNDARGTRGDFQGKGLMRPLYLATAYLMAKNGYDFYCSASVIDPINRDRSPYMFSRRIWNDFFNDGLAQCVNYQGNRVLETNPFTRKTSSKKVRLRIDRHRVEDYINEKHVIDIVRDPIVFAI